MRNVSGVVDLSVEQQTDIPTVRVQFDRQALARYGVLSGQAATALETALVGREVGQILEGRVAVPLVVRYPHADDPDLEAIRRIPLGTSTGAQVPIAAVASVREDRAPNFISRENGQRKITVMCNVAGRDLGSVVKDVQQRIAEAVTLPAGYRIEYGGQFESNQQASRLLFWLSAVVVAAMFFILTTAFRSASNAALIMINLPLALIGGAVGVFASGGVLSLASIIGLIALLGIATRNGIMLVSHIEQLREGGGVTDIGAAVIQGSINRLVPILMTALSTGLALVPVALRAGEPGSEIQAPMATVHHLRSAVIDRVEHARRARGLLCRASHARACAAWFVSVGASQVRVTVTRGTPPLPLLYRKPDLDRIVPRLVVIDRHRHALILLNVRLGKRHRHLPSEHPGLVRNGKDHRRLLLRAVVNDLHLDLLDLRNSSIQLCVPAWFHGDDRALVGHLVREQRSSGEH